MYVCMFVTLLQIDSSFLFLDGIKPFLGCQFFVWHSTKRCSSIFDLGPITPKFTPQNFGTKSPITRLVQKIKRRSLHLLGGFRGWPIQWNHTKCYGADPCCCHGTEIMANLGYFCTKLPISRLVCHIDPICLGLPGGPNRGPTVVAMATTFGLGTWYNRVPACMYVCMSVCHAPSNRLFFFVSRRNRAIFWPSVLRVALYKTLFFDF